jgi:hypothetical protein
MARLTLEALEQRDLLSANPLAASLAPPAPVAYLTINLENTMVSGFSASHGPGTAGQPMLAFSFAEVKFDY